MEKTFTSEGMVKKFKRMKLDEKLSLSNSDE